MTDVDGTRMPAETLLDTVRRALAHTDDRWAGISVADPDAAAALRALQVEWTRAAWQEVRQASEARSRAAEVDHETMSVTEYTEAVSIATRWADAIVALAGTPADGGRGLLDAVGRTVAAGYALLVARHGADAAGVIYDETCAAVRAIGSRSDGGG